MRGRASVAVTLVALFLAAPAGARVLLVGSYHGIRGQYSSIQSAVDVAKPGDWILIGPGDYHERGVKGIKIAKERAGVLIRTPRLHLRGMDRNNVIVLATA